MGVARKPRRAAAKPEPAGESLDPVELALAEQAAGAGADSPAAKLLTKQGRLIDLQIDLARDQRVSNRMKVVRDLALATGAVLVLGFAGWIVWDSVQADDLVLEAWTAPPAFAAAGQGGEVLAAQLGDRIRVMQQTGEIEATGVAKSAGGQSTELTLEIPETGVSVGEVQRWLRRTLGKQTVVGGSVVQLADGRVSVTVRPGEAAAASFEGAAADLPSLLDKAAEATLRHSDPLRYAGFLIAGGRLDEAAAVAEPLTRRGSNQERANAMANLVNILTYQGRTEEALVVARRSAALDPDSYAAVGYLAGAEYALRHEEEALATARRMVELTARQGDDSGLSQYMREEDPLLWPTMVADQQSDTRAAIAGYVALAELARGWNNPARARFWDKFQSQTWLRAHDLDAARAVNLGPPPAVNPQPERPGAGVTLREAVFARRVLAQTRLEEGRPAEARAIALEAVALQRQHGAGNDGSFLYGDGPSLAMILVSAGDLKTAHALVDATPMSCGRCVRARATLAAAERDWLRADRFFALATRLAPSFPQAWSAWGRSMAARGDHAAAIPLYRRAQKAGPGWADPLKFEGDALMAQGKASAAVKRYAIAAERAPKWGALHLAWGDALAKAGRKDQAVARWRAALGCGLTAADRATVNNRLARS